MNLEAVTLLSFASAEGGRFVRVFGWIPPLLEISGELDQNSHGVHDIEDVLLLAVIGFAESA